MTGFEIYTLTICILVYVLFVALFSFFIWLVTKSQLRMMRAGLEDEQIKKEYYQELNKKQHKGNFFKIVPVAFCVLFAIIFAFSAYSAFTQDGKVGALPTVKVVSSGSMSAKHESNKYLVQNNLNNQIQTFDLIVLHQLPAEEDIELYDVVVYEVDDYLLVHRVVGIEEPNDKHPNERYFLLQGDNVQYPDKFPVKYSQMKSIYKNERIPFVGSFVFFMQSPAGVLCFILMMASVAAISLVEKIILKERDARLLVIFGGQLPTSEAVADTVATTTTVEPTDEPTQDDLLIEEQIDDGYDFANSRRLTFAQKMELLSYERKTWLDEIIKVAKSIPGVAERTSKNGVTYRLKGKPVLKLGASRGYVYAYLAIDPTEFADKKYVGAVDVSATSTYASYPTRIKLTSQRKVKRVGNILNDKFGALKSVEFLTGYYGRKKRTLKYKLAQLTDEKKAWYKQIVAQLNQKEKITCRNGKYYLTFMRGRMAVAKVCILGKTLTVYLNVDPTLYSAKQYGAKDVSNVKAHSAYPAKIKVTSNRKVKYIIEIVKNI